ncbi:peptide deformylase [Pseudoxanthobacter sp.]|uniref:peptide deformylase n=1 Tax=Pseudoxanthobacter sp. TaxID=1925742 RepID=UPI002FE20DAB
MTVRDIVRFPDPRLKVPAAAVTAFGDDLAALVEDLADTMAAAPGIGITAPHIGVPQRVVVIRLSPAEPRRVFINPVITEASVDLARATEGSVSMPGVVETVERPARVTVRYQDAAGGVHSESHAGLMAVCLQHEIDQLDGRFWTERLSRLKRDRLVARYAKLRRAGS